MVFLQSRGQAGSGPVEPAHGLNGHDPVGHVGQTVRGREALDLLSLDPFNQGSAGSAVPGMVGEVVIERVGIHKDGVARRKVREGHGDSRIPNSGSRTIRSNVSASPAQGTIPAVCLAKLMAGSKVTRTFSCSIRGSGWAGLSTPSS